MTYKELLIDLANGYTYGKTYTTSSSGWIRYPYYKPMLYLIENNGAGRPCIGWSCWGSSANGFSENELQWIIENIFSETLDSFLKKYERHEAGYYI